MATQSIARRRLAIQALVAATLLPSRARSQDTAGGLRLYSDGGPASPYGAGARAFKAELERRTGGRIRVEPVLGTAAAGQALGPQRAQGRGLIEAVRAGDADLAIVSAAALGGLASELLVLDLPFLFVDAGSARAALDGPVGQELLAALAPQGLIGLGWGENGIRHLTTTARPVNGPGDLAGLAIRVQENEVHRETFAALGARPVSMPVLAEAVAALRDGRLDGQENALWVMPNLRMHEVQRHLSLTAHFYQSTAFLMSPAAHSRLADADREALAGAAAAGIAANRAAVDAADAAAFAQLQAAGMQIKPDPDRAAFLAAVQPVYARWRERLGVARIERLRSSQSR